jgi:hypothetical protein
MRPALGCVVLAWGVVACGATWAEGEAKSKAAKDKGVLVDLDGLQAQTPGDWKEEPPANRMRYMQFILPAAKGDKVNGEIIIFKDLGGSARDNVERWKKQFVGEGDKEAEASVKEITLGGRKATLLDIRGTYLFKTRPFDPNDKGEKRPDYRMLAIHFEGPKSLYHIKMTGPAKTIEQYKPGFEEWLKAFK